MEDGGWKRPRAELAGGVLGIGWPADAPADAPDVDAPPADALPANAVPKPMQPGARLAAALAAAMQKQHE